jgi:hypothetical protein
MDDKDAIIEDQQRQIAAVRAEVEELNRQLAAVQGGGGEGEDTGQDDAQSALLMAMLQEFRDRLDRLESDTGRTAANTHDHDRHIKDILSQLWGRNPEAGTAEIKWGKAAAAWTSGNTITLTPCVSQTSGTATGEPDVTATILSPDGATPAGLAIAADDILAYLETGVQLGVLLPVKQALSGVTTSPTALAPNPEGTETAASDTWLLSSGTACTCPFLTRTTYNPSGDRVLYQFYRTLTIDSAGRFAAISAETRVEVDAPTAHS